MSQSAYISFKRLYKKETLKSHNNHIFIRLNPFNLFNQTLIIFILTQ